MKKLVIGAAVAGGAAFALHRLAGKARKLRDHCHEMMAGCKESTPTISPGCGS